jgi:hypothetical protein
MLSRFYLPLLFALQSSNATPQPGVTQYYGYILVIYDKTDYRTSNYVSQVFGYCSSMSDPVNELEKQAKTEVELLEGQGQIIRPPNTTKMRVSLHGGNLSRANAERSRDYWVNHGAGEYESGLDAVYYPAKVCSW